MQIPTFFVGIFLLKHTPTAFIIPPAYHIRRQFYCLTLFRKKLRRVTQKTFETIVPKQHLDALIFGYAPKPRFALLATLRAVPLRTFRYYPSRNTHINSPLQYHATNSER